MDDIRATYQAHIAAVLKLAGIADADGEGRSASSISRRRSPASHASRDGLGGRPEGEQPRGRAPSSAGARPASTGARSSPRPASIGSRRSSSGSRAAITGIAALVASEPLDDVEGLPRVPRARAPQRRSCRRRSSTSDSRSTARSLSGTPQQRERWKRAVDATNDALGEAVGKIYVAASISRPRAKAAARGDGRRTSSPRSTGASTRSTGWRRRPRRSAKAKLATLKVGVGYPDKWRDYSTLEVVRGDAFGNAERAELFDYRLQPREARRSPSIAANGG